MTASTGHKICLNTGKTISGLLLEKLHKLWGECCMVCKGYTVHINVRQINSNITFSHFDTGKLAHDK